MREININRKENLAVLAKIVLMNIGRKENLAGLAKIV